jgi:hypothetical protein
MIYRIQANPELVVETDSLEFVKKVVRAHPECTIRELGTGKVYRPRLIPPSGNTGARPGPGPQPKRPAPAAEGMDRRSA